MADSGRGLATPWLRRDERPKSMSCTSPVVGDTRRLEGLMSRCRTSRAWTRSMPSATRSASETDSATPSARPASSELSGTSPRSSITICATPSWTSKPTTPGAPTPPTEASMSCSRRKRASSASAGKAPRSCLTTTVRRSDRRRARVTRLWVPSCSTSMCSYTASTFALRRGCSGPPATGAGTETSTVGPRRAAPSRPRWPRARRAASPRAPRPADRRTSQGGTHPTC